MPSAAPESMDALTCANCGTNESDHNELKTCNASKMMRYCCRDCQVSHWPRHKQACKKRAAELFDKELFKDPPEREECPICMLPLPFEGGKDSKVLVACCGRIICVGCIYAQFKEDVNNGKELEDCQACAFCRTPTTTSEKEQYRRLNKNVERNHAPSIYQLAMYHERGIQGVQKDVVKAIELFEKSGRLGHASSYNSLGIIYHDGKYGLESDIKKARYYYKLGTIGGCIYARHSLGTLEWQVGNMERAFKHALICAKAGLREPLEMLKLGCKNGRVTKDEYAEALREYQKRQDDTRSEARDQALRYINSGLSLEMEYHRLRAIEEDLSSFYKFACLCWDEGNFEKACKAFLICAEYGIGQALKRLKIGVKNGYVTADEYAKALRECSEGRSYNY